MSNQSVIIRDVKAIRELVFNIPDPGMYVLVGPNGSGKTTLLAALYRIGYKNAFADYFKTSLKEKTLDYFGNASVTYSVDSQQVSYNYGNTRWSPTPKSNSKLLARFGFPNVIFIAADAKRIEPTSDEMRTNRIKPANRDVISEVKSILADSKFDNLKVINTKRGIGNEAYLIQTKVSGQNYYFSEKNFSLGELCVLKLVVELRKVPENSLILIDEFDMALHPKAQAALFRYMDKATAEKKLTLIFSTHSTSVIKRAGRNRILLLKNDREGLISCTRKAFPAQALGDIAVAEDIQPDFLFFVEDYCAKFLLEEMVELYKSEKTYNSAAPYYKVVPVGGFQQVIEFLINSDQIFSDTVKRFAFLDKDVEEESLQKAEDNKQYDLLKKFRDNKQRICYLPCTPELGVINLIESDPILHSSQLKSRLSRDPIDLKRMVEDPKYIEIKSTNPRKQAKKRLDRIVVDTAKRTGIHEDRIRRDIISYYVQERFGGAICELKKTFGPIIG